VSLVADRLQGGPGGRWCWSGTVRRSRHVRRYADPPVTSNLRRHHLAVGSPQEARDAQATGSGPALPCCRTCPVIDRRSAGTDTRPSLMCGRPERALAALWNRPTPPT